MSWVEEDGVREIGTPAWTAWSEWNDDLIAAMQALGFQRGPHFLIEDETSFLPQNCQICRHITEIKEALVGQIWEEPENQ